MGKIQFIFLCFFFVAVFGSSDENQEANSIREIPKEFLTKMRELEKFREEFQEFKSSLVELSAAFVQFHQSLTPNAESGATGTTREVDIMTSEKSQEYEYDYEETTENPAFKSATSCSDLMKIFPRSQARVNTIYPHGNNSKSVRVLCDFESDGGGWRTIQKRTSGPVHDFQGLWSRYSRGLGSVDGDFFLGLEDIHTLTKNGDQELRIELEDWEGGKRWAQYSSFSISDASDFYRLSISGFSPDSTAGDSMTNPDYGSSNMLNGMRFSTLDKDNDLKSGHYLECSNDFGSGGWWFNNCSVSNLNGLRFEKGFFEAEYMHRGIRWDSWKGANYSLAKTEMKIRTRENPNQNS